MRRAFLLFGLVITIPFALMAQRNGPEFGVHAGGSFPAGDFGAGGSALSETRGGFAEPGVTGGVEITFPLMPNRRLGWISSLMIHSHSTDYTTFFQTGGYEGTSGSWLLITPLTGLRYRIPFAADFAAYALVQGGAMYGRSPHIVLATSQGAGKQESATGTSFAYNVGVGIVVGNLVNMGFRYLHGEPAYRVTESFGTQTGQKTFVQKSTMVQLIIGFLF